MTAPAPPSHRDLAYLVAHAVRRWIADGVDVHWVVDDPAWPVICVHTGPQVSWPIPKVDVLLFPDGIPPRPADSDGHRPADTYARLSGLAPLPEPILTGASRA